MQPPTGNSTTNTVVEQSKSAPLPQNEQPTQSQLTFRPRPTRSLVIISAIVVTLLIAAALGLIIFNNGAKKSSADRELADGVATSQKNLADKKPGYAPAEIVEAEDKEGSGAVDSEPSSYPNALDIANQVRLRANETDSKSAALAIEKSAYAAYAENGKLPTSLAEFSGIEKFATIAPITLPPVKPSVIEYAVCNNGQVMRIGRWNYTEGKIVHIYRDAKSSEVATGSNCTILAT